MWKGLDGAASALLLPGLRLTKSCIIAGRRSSIAPGAESVGAGGGGVHCLKRRLQLLLDVDLRRGRGAALDHGGRGRLGLRDGEVEDREPVTELGPVPAVAALEAGPHPAPEHALHDGGGGGALLLLPRLLVHVAAPDGGLDALDPGV